MKENSKIKFPCTKCGACCRNIGRLVSEARTGKINSASLPGVVAEVRAFPFLTPNGVCEKYDSELGCTVYESRPDMCNIEKMYNKHYKNIGLPYLEYLQINAHGCNLLIDAMELGEEKKVIL